MTGRRGNYTCILACATIAILADHDLFLIVMWAASIIATAGLVHAIACAEQRDRAAWDRLARRTPRSLR